MYIYNSHSAYVNFPPKISQLPPFPLPWLPHICLTEADGRKTSNISRRRCPSSISVTDRSRLWRRSSRSPTAVGRGDRKTRAPPPPFIAFVRQRTAIINYRGRPILSDQGSSVPSKRSVWPRGARVRTFFVSKILNLCHVHAHCVRHRCPGFRSSNIQQLYAQRAIEFFGTVFDASRSARYRPDVPLVFIRHVRSTSSS